MSDNWQSDMVSTFEGELERILPSRGDAPEPSGPTLAHPNIGNSDRKQPPWRRRTARDRPGEQ